MKRIISLCCVALICVFSLAAPAQAAGIDNTENWLDVLAYDTVADSGNFFYYSNTARTITLDLPYTTYLYDIDMVFTCSVSNGTQLPSLKAVWNTSSTNLTISAIGDKMYRAYGKVPSGNYAQLKLEFGAASGVTYYITLQSCRVATTAIQYWDIEAYCNITAVDYSATIHYVPTDLTNSRRWTSPSNFEDSFFWCYVYVTDWEKYDYIDFQLMFHTASINSISAMVDSRLIPVTVQTIESTTLGASSYYVTMRLDLTGIEKPQEVIPTIQIYGNLHAGQSNTIDFAYCSGAVVVGSGNTFVTFMRKITNVLTNGFQSVVNALGGSTAAGDKFTQEVGQEIDELQEQQAILDSVTKPAIKDIDVSVDQYVSQADVQVLAQPMTVIFENSIFSKMIIMSILLATVSYTLFGKK